MEVILENKRYLVEYSSNIDGYMMYAIWLKISDCCPPVFVKEFKTMQEAEHYVRLGDFESAEEYRRKKAK